MKGHPVFARFYRLLMRASEKAERPYREELAGGATGRVLEVGAGQGANLEHYPAGAWIVLSEPDPSMLAELTRTVVRSGRRPLVVQASAGALPFHDGVFDAVVTSLVLCTVPDVPATLSEIRRVLGQGGTLRFYEHVRSDDSSFARRQDRMERPWGFFAGGCHPNRDTVAALRAGGYGLDHRAWIMPRAWLAGPHVIGSARPE